MKHSYRAECSCKRCNVERNRRTMQAASNSGVFGRILARPRNARKPRTRKPAYGSQEWAETYADDLGESEDR